MPQATARSDEVETEFGQKSRKKIVFILLLVVALLAAGAVAVFLRGGSQKPSPPAPGPEPHAANPALNTTPTPTSEALPTSTGAKKLTVGERRAPSEGRRTAHGGGELPGAPGPDPKTTGFAELFARGAKQAGKP